jgi:hypothetical protein
MLQPQRQYPRELQGLTSSWLNVRWCPCFAGYAFVYMMTRRDGDDAIRDLDG